MTGTLITFEGSEGSGKSTQAKLLYDYLLKKKKKILHVREPGSVKISETIRRVLLDTKNTKMSAVCETLLYMAARSQLVEEVIEPAYKAGKIILCDRFLDSTVVYQGYGNGVNIDLIKSIGNIVTKGITPNLTFVFDIETKKGLFRKGKVKDRIELRSLQYHNLVRKGYLQLARQEPHRIKVLKADRSREDIQREILKYIEPLLDHK